jgi:hypothetical protein
MSIHEQVLAKVNVPVDRNLVELVEALSLFAELQTIECDEQKNGDAWVCFVYGNQEKPEPWKPLSKFVFSTLGPELTEKFGDRIALNVQLTESGSYRAEMTVKKPAISAVVKLLKSLKGKSQAA